MHHRDVFVATIVDQIVPIKVPEDNDYIIGVLVSGKVTTLHNQKDVFFAPVIFIEEASCQFNTVDITHDGVKITSLYNYTAYRLINAYAKMDDSKEYIANKYNT